MLEILKQKGSPPHISAADDFLDPKIALDRNKNDSAKTGNVLDVSADTATEITEEEKLIPFAKKKQTL